MKQAHSGKRSGTDRMVCTISGHFFGNGSRNSQLAFFCMLGKSFIARRMFGKAVAELDNPTRPFGNEAAEGECGAIESWQMVNDFE